MILNNAGKMIDSLYRDTISHHKNVYSVAHIVMPNHLHAVIALERADMESAPTLSEIFQTFKRNTTIKYIAAVKNGLYPPFDKRVWQRNFYERVVRNEEEYWQILQYIQENPAQWLKDPYYNYIIN